MGESPECRTLLVRKIPSSFTPETVQSLLAHFGSTSVNYLGSTGWMKNCAFATFPDTEQASNTLKRLHQLEVLGSRLVVEYARSDTRKGWPSELSDPPPAHISDKGPPPTSGLSDEHSNSKVGNAPEDFLKRSSIDAATGLESAGLQRLVAISDAVPYALNHGLKYSYPSPTAETLTNITIALAAVPKFYTQVLHLMNKMNLPAPFGMISPMPPIPSTTGPAGGAHQPSGITPSSSSESELESGGEQGGPTIDSAASTVSTNRKRLLPSVTSGSTMTKRRKIVAPPRVLTSAGDAGSGAVNRLGIDELFERVGKSMSATMAINQPVPKQIAINAPSTLASVNTSVTATRPASSASDSLSLATDDNRRIGTPSDSVSSGFGKILPRKPQNDSVGTKDGDNDNETTDDEEGDSVMSPSDYITRRELRRGTLCRQEMNSLSVFRGYAPGVPSSRLYIKNVAKGTEERELKRVYGRYVEWTESEERDSFDIRLMTEGRMKGQAFVTLPNEAAAKRAVKETNAFVLNGKPLVVNFARSAKLK